MATFPTDRSNVSKTTTDVPAGSTPAGQTPTDRSNLTTSTESASKASETPEPLDAHVEPPAAKTRENAAKAAKEK